MFIGFRTPEGTYRSKSYQVIDYIGYGYSKIYFSDASSGVLCRDILSTHGIYGVLTSVCNCFPPPHNAWSWDFMFYELLANLISYAFKIPSKCLDAQHI